MSESEAELRPRKPYPLEFMPPCPECGGRLAVLSVRSDRVTSGIYNDLSTLHCLLRHPSPDGTRARWERQYGAVPINEGLVAKMYERLAAAGIPRLTAMQAATNLIMADEASE